MSRSPSRHLPLFIVIAAVCAGAGLYLGQKWAQSSQAGSEAPALAAGTDVRVSSQTLAYPTPRDLQPFELRRVDGSALTNAALEGQWTLAFFGFTNCPDVCPSALATFKQLEKLAPGGGDPRLAFLFVSVDPPRDSPQLLRDYTAYFSPSIVAATGEPDAIERFARDVGVVFMRVAQDDGEYTIDHSTQMLLFNPAGRLHAILRPPHDPAAMLTDIARMTAAYRSGPPAA